MRLLFCKIYDEKKTKDLELVDFANRPNENETDLAIRIKKLFEIVKSKYPDIFEIEEQIEIPPKELSFIITKIEKNSILNADRDIIADAFEELIGTGFRGGEGQFFTPRNIVQMMIDILQPNPSERIIDPACGSGGFIAYILKNFIKNHYHYHNIYGVDKDLFLSRLAKIYLTLLGENEYHIFCENSLEAPKSWSIEAQKHIELNSFDCILTNPPFGAKIPVIGYELLSQYKLGYYWNKSKDGWVLTKNLREKQPPQILFIERIIQLLKPGGRAGIVLPEGIFGNPSDRYIWEFIRKYTSIMGIISLSQETFQPSTHTKTSIVFIEKKNNNNKKIFMAIANAVGHNKNGKEIFKTNKNGSFIFDKNWEKILDDDTPIIGNNFKKFIDNESFIESHLGFTIQVKDIKNNIFIPENYNPEIKKQLEILKNNEKYSLVTIGELVEEGLIEIKRGNEIGSQFYGTGSIPFVRTSDIVNWEIKFDPIKSIAEEIYEKYKYSQDVRENDILFVNDGTFLIGRSAMITKNDEKCVIQSHLRKIRLLKTNNITPYYLFYLLNTKIVQQQIEKHTFVQATLSTLGNRILEIVLPIHKNLNEMERLSNEIESIIKLKAELKIKTNYLILNSI